MKIGDLVKIDLHLFGRPPGRRLGVVTKLYPSHESSAAYPLPCYLDVTVPSERATVTLVGMEDVEFITGAGTLAEDNKKKE